MKLFRHISKKYIEPRNEMSKDLIELEQNKKIHNSFTYENKRRTDSTTIQNKLEANLR